MSSQSLAAHLPTVHPAKKTPVVGEDNILVTSALPYVNNVPHLGNIVGSVLSADVFSRYNKARNRNTLYVCGTDEYGTATETKALEEGTTPQALCDRYHRVHKEVYEWFDIGFDCFGRTTTEKQTEIGQHIFTKLLENGFLEERTEMQPYCTQHGSFLADRFVEGVCPRCGYEDARGDQCDQCGGLLNALDLKDARCKLDGATPLPRETTHVHLCLDRLQPQLEDWFAKSAAAGGWSSNGTQITRSWLKEGLKPRAITRDLRWGTPVPLQGYEDKVLYVWFDACIGYVSITATHLADWEIWWRNPDVKLYQFMGKDNVPFHSVIFPASQIGTGEKWTMLHHLSTSEYLNYETGKFSKSRNVGVFGDSVRQTGIPASVWRYYLLANRPEKSDSRFDWTSFVQRNNSELVANLGNLVNRVIKFTNKNLESRVPDYGAALHEPAFNVLKSDINRLLARYIDDMEAVRLRAGLETAMAISTRGNQFLTENKFGASLLADNPGRGYAVIGIVLNLIYLLSAVFYPYIPSVSDAMAKMLNAPPRAITPTWQVGDLLPGHEIRLAKHLFTKIDEKMADKWRAQFGGSTAPGSPSQVSETHVSESGQRGKYKPEELSQVTSPRRVDFRVGHIIRAVKHPDADFLFVSTVDCGDKPGTDHTSLDLETGKTVRHVCSGLNGKIALSELQGRRVVLVANMKPVKMRGVTSAAMLLTAVSDDTGQGQKIELIAPPDGAQSGERLSFEGFEGVVMDGAMNPKHKIWEAVQQGLRTTMAGDVVWCPPDTGRVEISQARKLVSKQGRPCTVETLYNASVC
ncbi:putative methionine--tRNA ligase, cytoplasmic protein rar1 [Aspergillus tubingensis]|nr:putative methionine--tRNA ligase, cytoplasmic protein rar1 [Aspergillus tubingensis]